MEMKMTGKRKTFTDTFKAKVALEAVQGGKTLAQLASEYKVHPNLISTWKKRLVSGAPELFAKGNGLAGKTEEELTAPLFEEIGRLKMDLRWLEKKL
jgi:transposase